MCRVCVYSVYDDLYAFSNNIPRVSNKINIG